MKQQGFRDITHEEFLALKAGDAVYLQVGAAIYESKVIGEPYYNSDADEPDWEVETTKCTCDQHSLLVPMEQEDIKTLFVLERSNGYYGGYEFRDGEYALLFNTDKELLFNSIKNYTDKGYSIICLDKTKEAEFMEGRTTLQDYLANMGIPV